MNQVLFALFFFTPGFFANASASISSKLRPLNQWNTPLDLGKKLSGKRILGDHKTIRGFIIGTLSALIVGSLQYLMIRNNLIKTEFSLYESLLPTLLIAFLIGFGALTGDSIKSFFKRRLDIAPGKPWLPFDWIDYVLGGIVFSFPKLYPGLKVYLILIFSTPVINIVANLISGLIGLKKEYI